MPEVAQQEAVDNLIGHAEALKAYRIAVVDPPKDSSISEVREFRAQFDTTYAALYYPWVRIVDPNARPDPGTPPATLDLPPSGFAAGIYARSRHRSAVCTRRRPTRSCSGSPSSSRT